MIKRLARYVSRFMLSCALFGMIWLAGLLWFVHKIPERPSSNLAVTDAIVVLTGGKGRIGYGLSLLAEHKAHRLFISGVGEQATPADVVRSTIQRSNLPLFLDKVIVLGYSATSTIENAMETAQWMRKENLRSLRLVTANYHMPRSLLEFRAAMPGITIIPDPVIPEGFNRNEWWQEEQSTRLALSEYNKYLLAKVRHWLISWSEPE